MMLPPDGQPIPRLVIAAPQGRSGKTTLSLGVCAALAGRGWKVQPFKKGPDYIDPSWLGEAARRACRSLDPFFVRSPQGLRESFLRGAAGAQFCLIEGNHGLYDSSLPGEGLEGGPEEGSGSTAAVARSLRAPVLLVLDTQRTGRSAAAIVRGCQVFEPDTPIAAVVLNHVANPRHEAKLRSAIEHACGIPVVGALPRDEGLAIPDRHLGLVPRGEQEETLPAMEACRQAVEQYVDLDALLRIAASAGPLPGEYAPRLPVGAQAALRARIGVLRDRAFTFYYPENLEALIRAGAELLMIDALQDADLPPVDALYCGGGFPEIFMSELSANLSLRLAIRQAAAEGMPIYAECGGMMYLAQGIRWGERRAEMVGALPFEVEMTPRPQGHGYVLARSNGNSAYFLPDTELRGHEFHHSRLVGLDPQAETFCGLDTAYRLSRGRGLGAGRDGLVSGSLLAGYTHIHADGCPSWAPAFLRLASGRI